MHQLLIQVPICTQQHPFLPRHLLFYSHAMVPTSRKRSNPSEYGSMHYLFKYLFCTQTLPRHLFLQSGRGGHASCVLPQGNELVVFGGVKNGKWLNSVSILDTNRWVWSTIKAVGDAPRPRSYHR